MSGLNCLRCLARPSVRPLIPAPLALQTKTPAASFSTTARNDDVLKKKKTPQSTERTGMHIKKSPFVKKKQTIDPKAGGKAPLPGERKAFRKRIVLSNDSAVPVKWLEDMNGGSLTDEANLGRVLSLPPQLQDQLRASEAFKTTQCWGMFRKPSMLVRGETVSLMKRLQAAAEEKKTVRVALTGEKGTGKSMLALQAMSHAFLNEWMVINIPEGQDLTTAATEYSPLPDTDPVQYSQPVYALKLIQAIKKANEPILTRLQTVSSHPELPQNIPTGASLLSLANVAKDPDSAWAVFQALWSELTAKHVPRPPILFTLDGLAHIMRVSDYRSPSFDLIHSFDLALVRHFVDCLSGATVLPHGGAVIAVTSRSNAPRNPSTELSLARAEAAQKGVSADELPVREPYGKGYDDRVEAALKDVGVVKVGAVSKGEGRSLMEYWAASGLLRAAVDEKEVSAKWTLGSGVLAEMERAALLNLRI